MAMLADKIQNINIKKVFDVLLLDKRWYGRPSDMSKYVFPGVGFGGYCLPKDLDAIINFFKKNKLKPKLLESVSNVNQDIKKHNLRNILNKIKNKNTKIGFVGLSFKKGSDDIRETPSYYYIKKMIEKKYKNIYVYDELALESFKKKFPLLKIKYCKSLKEIKLKTTYLVLLTNVKIPNNLKNKKIIDLKYQI